MTKMATGQIAGQPYRFVCGHNGRLPLMERFWRFVDRRADDEYWPWTGRLTAGGYGHFTYTMTINGKMITTHAHRFSYERHCGPIPVTRPRRTVVMHACDNRRCVNPGHLRLGFDRDNSGDMVAKRRQAFGDRHPAARLTADDVRRLREECTSGDYRVDALAARYGVHRNTIRRALNGQRWPSVDKPTVKRTSAEANRARSRSGH